MSHHFLVLFLNGSDKVIGILDEQLKMIIDKLKLIKIRKGETVLFRGWVCSSQKRGTTIMVSCCTKYCKILPCHIEIIVCFTFMPITLDVFISNVNFNFYTIFIGCFYFNNARKCVLIETINYFKLKLNFEFTNDDP